MRVVERGSVVVKELVVLGDDGEVRMAWRMEDDRRFDEAIVVGDGR